MYQVYHKQISINLDEIPINAQCSVGIFGTLCSSDDNYSMDLRQSLAVDLIQKAENKDYAFQYLIEYLGKTFSLSSRFTAFIAVSGEPIKTPSSPNGRSNDISLAIFMSSNYILLAVFAIFTIILSTMQLVKQ